MSITQSSRTKRRPPGKRPVNSRFNMRARFLLATVVILFALFLWAFLARNFAPHGNTSATRFDTIIVLGYPADDDGNPTPTQLSRVTEAVHEYERGVAPRLIMTGGSAHNHFVEANVMAKAAEAQGIPSSAIYIEANAQDTLQNACYSFRMMKEHEWRSAEIISSPSHLPRAGLIFDRFPIAWRTHPAPPQSPQASHYDSAANSLEVLKTLRFLLYARWTESCQP